MKREKKAPSNVVAFPVSVNTRDALSDQIQVAIGIQYAVMGQAHVAGHDSSPISQLLDDHIAALESIAKDLNAG